MSTEIEKKFSPRQAHSAGLREFHAILAAGKLCLDRITQSKNDDESAGPLRALKAARAELEKAGAQ